MGNIKSLSAPLPARFARSDQAKFDEIAGPINEMPSKPEDAPAGKTDMDQGSASQHENEFASPSWFENVLKDYPESPETKIKDDKISQEDFYELPQLRTTTPTRVSEFFEGTSSINTLSSVKEKNRQSKLSPLVPNYGHQNPNIPEPQPYSDPDWSRRDSSKLERKVQYQYGKTESGIAKNGRLPQSDFLEPDNFGGGPSIHSASDSENANQSLICPSLINHRGELYKLELDALDYCKTETDGILSFNVKKMVCSPVDSDENEYYVNHSNPKGIALLISNHNYHGDAIRTGTYVDFANMLNLLHQLDFEVCCKIDRSADQMKNDAVEFVQLFAEKSSCNRLDSCIVTLLTHGSYGNFIGIDGTLLDQEEFFQIFMKHPSLSGKPKIFIIQACRASAAERIFDLTNMTRTRPRLPTIKMYEVQARQEFASHIPDCLDTCVLYSTSPGYFNWQNQERGSSFIQTVCTVISYYAHEPWADLVTLFARIRRHMSEKFIFQNNYTEPPGVVVQMEKKFHFLPGVK